tara:strand:- start:405 stop:1319 length:915 start_codon:yes stop_codon:yes gene_type:complete
MEQLKNKLDILIKLKLSNIYLNYINYSDDRINSLLILHFNIIKKIYNSWKKKDDCRSYYKNTFFKDIKQILPNINYKDGDTINKFKENILYNLNFLLNNKISNTNKIEKKEKKEKRRKNKGTGAGGKKTNKNGLSYEDKVKIKENKRYKYTDIINISNKKIDVVKIDNIQFIKANKRKLNIYMKQYKKYKNPCPDGCKILQPDDCYIDEKNKIIYIIEIKYQEMSGSVDEKIQSGPCKRYSYNRLYPKYNIKYCYCLNNWYKSEKYYLPREFLENNNIKIFWGDDNDYQDNILDWITNKKKYNL